MDRYRVLERLSGMGTILKADGSVLFERRYQLTVSQRMIDDGRGGTVPGMFRVEGRLVLQGMEGLMLVTENAALTLRLQDGRTLPFFFSSSDGTIAASGKLEPGPKAGA